MGPQKTIPQTATRQAPAWTAGELADPHANADKPTKIRLMFGAIARSYDLNNRLHSFGRDQAWRRAGVRAARVQPGDTILDVACGTGDLTHEFARSRADAVIGLDFVPEMLEIARAKQRAIDPALRGKVTYMQGDAMQLPFEDACIDVVSIAFGIRNVADPRAALAEFHRVLRPGGRLVILEFDTPRFAPARWASNLYTNRIMPLTATLVSRDRSGAYRYLPRSVASFLDGDALAGAISEAGFQDVATRRLTMGVCACHSATRPE
jgi:demethylmenaquinone methyltransferase/2-methoxy-6-polyprenyl-1,4-benzoquinol methylase